MTTESLKLAAMVIAVVAAIATVAFLIRQDVVETNAWEAECIARGGSPVIIHLSKMCFAKGVLL